MPFGRQFANTPIRDLMISIKDMMKFSTATNWRVSCAAREIPHPSFFMNLPNVCWRCLQQGSVTYSSKVVVIRTLSIAVDHACGNWRISSHFGCGIFYFLFKLDVISSCLLGAELRYLTLSVDTSDFIPTFIDPFILRRWCLRTFPQSQSDDVIFMVPFKGGATPPLAGPFRKPGCTTVGSQHKAATEHGKTSISS